MTLRNWLRRQKVCKERTKQNGYFDYILKTKPKLVIFNPGTENDELENLLKENAIQPVEACTLVMLATGQY